MPFYPRLRKPKSSSPKHERRRIRTIKGLKALRAALRDHFGAPADRMGTVRIGTWNIREFGNTKYGGRDTFEPLYYMAEIISNFDIVALQEVSGDLGEFLDLMHLLGPDWDYIATDVTDGHAGNGERMVFLFNRNRASFRHIAGELTLPEGQKILASFGERIRLEGGISLQLPDGRDLSGIYDGSTKKTSSGKIKLRHALDIPLPEGAFLKLPEGTALALAKGTEVTRPEGTRGKAKVSIPQGEIAGRDYRLRFPGSALDESFKQFARTPFLVSFQSGWLKINLTTVHIYYGDASNKAVLAQRRREIAELTRALGTRAEKEMKANPGSKVLTAVLGDFNILSKEHETMEALEANGFVVPAQIRAIPGSNVPQDKAYDQIAFWQPERDRGYVNLKIVGSGVFDFFQHVYRSDAEELYAEETGGKSFSQWRTYKMSDHLPMWVELESDFSDAYLDACDDGND
ncbi:MAG: endonuclease [Rhodobacterales bacterium]|nr:MAG: endonuclease [Rhodobacterales bacterium]